jgi:hypothetical protein
MRRFRTERTIASMASPYMKKLVLVCMLLLALPAQAEFTKYFEDDELVAYLDPASIARSGNEARLWTIDDYRKAQTDIEGRKPYSSVKAQWIFDCARRMSDVLIAFYHAGPMAQGEEVHSGAADQRQWDKVVPGSVGELAFRAACRSRGKP